jgi:hypothetical protein
MRWLGQEVQSPRLKCATDSNRLWFKSILLMLRPEKSLCWIQKFNPSRPLSVKGLAAGMSKLIPKLMASEISRN